MSEKKHFEFLSPRGGGKSEYRDILCSLLKKELNINGYRSRDVAYLSLGKRKLPAIVGGAGASYRLGKIISKTVYPRRKLEREACRLFLENNKEAAKILDDISHTAGKDAYRSFSHWFTTVAGRYRLSRIYLKGGEAICYGGGFIFCLEHLFGAVPQERIEGLMSLLPKPDILIRIRVAREDLLRVHTRRGSGGSVNGKIEREEYVTGVLESMARNQGIKIVSFRNDYINRAFPEKTKNEIVNFLKRKRN